MVPHACEISSQDGKHSGRHEGEIPDHPAMLPRSLTDNHGHDHRASRNNAELLAADSFDSKLLNS